MKRWLICVFMGLMVGVSDGGYRNASTLDGEISKARAHWTAQIVRSGQVPHAVPNRGGRFDTVEVDALQVVEVRLAHPEVPAGATVIVYTINGGRINGKITDTLTVAEGGEILFTFRAGRYFGDYPVVVRWNGQEETLTFWVKQANLPQESEVGTP